MSGEAIVTTPVVPGAPSAPAAAAQVPPQSAAPSAVAPPAAGNEPPAGGATAPPAASVPSAPPAGSPPAWWQARIDALTAQREAEKRKNAELEARLKTAGVATSPASSQGAPAVAAPSAMSEADLQSLINSRAAELASLKRFDEECTAAASAGRKLFPETFEARVSELSSKLIDRSDPSSIAAYNTFIRIALDTGQAPSIIHELGGDINLAMQLLSLPPTKMAVELTKLAGGLEAKEAPAAAAAAAVSGAPKPITPVGSGGAQHNEISPDDPGRADKLSTEEWMRRRSAQAPNGRPQFKRAGAAA